MPDSQQLHGFLPFLSLTRQCKIRREYIQEGGAITHGGKREYSFFLVKQENVMKRLLQLCGGTEENQEDVRTGEGNYIGG